MRIGVAREIKSDEYRVALTPAGALELINNGHEVAVETGAGLGSSFPDEAYERVGVQITSVDDVWERSDLVLKVKEPIAAEYARLREGQILFTYLHIAADEPLTREMIAGMKEGAVVVDVAIDQGGCFETSHATTHADPVYVVDGVTHYCVANMPGGVPITSTKALTNATLPYVEAIANQGLPAAVAADPALP